MSLDSSAEFLSGVAVEHTGDLLAAMGNHEGKAALVAAMEPGAYYGRNDLAHLVTDPAEGGASFINRNSPIAWCQQSLGRFGLVARAGNSTPEKHELTESGEAEGKPLAGLLLPVSDEYNRSLTTIWGGTETRGKIRSPLSRYLIVNTLLRTDYALTPGQIDGETGLGNTMIALQLAAMRRDGVAQYDEWNLVGQDVTFSLPNKAHASSPTASKSLVEALQLLRTNKSATLSELEDYAWSALSAAEQERQDRARFRYDLNSALNDMTGSDLLVREEGRERSESSYLTDEQRGFWTDVMGKLQTYMKHEPDTMRAFTDAGKRFLAQPAKVSAALHRAHYSQKRSHDKDLKAIALQYVNASDGPVSVRDFADHVTTEHGRRISLTGARLAMTALSESAAIAAVPYKGRINLFEKKHPED